MAAAPMTALAAGAGPPAKMMPTREMGIGMLLLVVMVGPGYGPCGGDASFYHAAGERASDETITAALPARATPPACCGERCQAPPRGSRARRRRSGRHHT